MSARTGILFEILGCALLVGALGAGYALLRDGATSWVELAGIVGLAVLGALMIDAKRIVGPLERLIGAVRGMKPPPGEA